MKTEISRFCEACAQSLQTLPAAIATAADRMEKGSEPALLQRPLAILNDIRARLRSLTDKLGSQQAYLLIFGPLKSGKSTLMNAISGAYVSEVTSLPGYPCLVFVSHSTEPTFSVTRYNGRESSFANGNTLKDVITDGHFALAEQIRVAERRGETFDPRSHFTEAIRRVDIKVPVETLAESSTVLVDTPGLYSRMNFSYGVITREFRNSAACAVFVVKTDNLFLEQVFAEFNQLLGLFSRIFLVINVDSHKRDLQPDGSLLPSAESQHPEKIIEAFKTLSMAGPLREAYETGRVRIHAVDLMSAASAFLSKTSSPNTDRQKAAFDAFQRDLTEYLNSSDYTREFIGDSLRQGYHLCAEARSICDGSELHQLKQRQEQLTVEIEEIDRKLAAVDRLLKVDWDATFDKPRTENSRRSEEVTSRESAKLTRDMEESLEQWYAGSESLKDLIEVRWNQLIATAAKSLADQTQARVRQLLDTPIGGTEPGAMVMTDLHIVGIPLQPVAQASAPSLNAEAPLEAYRMTIDPSTIPVRKTLGDWFLFRRLATVRTKLFGEDLGNPVDPATKQKRLPELCRDALMRAIDETVTPRFATLPSKYAGSLLGGYVLKYRTSVLSGLRERREQLVSEREARQAPYDANAQLLGSLLELNEQTNFVARELESLAKVEHVELNTVPYGRIEAVPTVHLTEPHAPPAQVRVMS